ADWSAERPWKYWLFLAVSILLGMGLAFGVVAFSLSFFRDDTGVAVIPDQNSGGEANPAETPRPGPATETPGAKVTPEAEKSPAEKVEKPATVKTETPEVPAKGK